MHAPLPYRWQRCEAVLYTNILLLSWIVQGGGRGIVTLDLLNCTEVRSVASPTHPSTQDDVGTLAAKAQTANAQAEGFGELGLMETLCPFQLFYSDGVERLGAESARERVRWVSAIWCVSFMSAILLAHDVFREVLDRSVTVSDRSETQSPTESMRTIRSMASASTNSSSAVSGSRSTTFLPPMDTIHEISDPQSLSGSSIGSLSRQPLLRSYAVDDGAISNQIIVYPGDMQVIAPGRSGSLRRTPSDIESTSSMSTTMIARNVPLPASVSSPSPAPSSPVTSARSVGSTILPLPGPSPVGAPDSLAATSLLPRSPTLLSMPTAIVSMTSPRGGTPSIRATVRSGAPGMDRDALTQTDALQDGQLSTNNVLDDLGHRCPALPDNTELVERLQRLEDMITRLVTVHDRGRRRRQDKPGPDLLNKVHRLRGRRTPRVGLIQHPRDEPEPTVAVSLFDVGFPSTAHAYAPCSLLHLCLRHR